MIVKEVKFLLGVIGFSFTTFKHILPLDTETWPGKLV